jgi:hypothetical protein
MSLNTPQRVGARVRQRRLCAKLNTHQAAILAGISREEWLAIEDGRCVKIDVRIRYVAVAIGCPLSLLVVDEDGGAQ